VNYMQILRSILGRPRWYTGDSTLQYLRPEWHTNDIHPAHAVIHLGMSMLYVYAGVRACSRTARPHPPGGRNACRARALT
jgi:hypothetical protein